MEDNKKMCYIDDIFDDIKDVINATGLNKDKLTSIFEKDPKVWKFLDLFNTVSKNKDSRFVYKSVNFLMKNQEVMNVAWNFKKEFPMFLIKTHTFNNKKYLDENFCMPAPTPPELQELLNEFKSKIK